ncbi:NAD(P)H-dependent oxidoreductase [Sphingomonas oryzagri]
MSKQPASYRPRHAVILAHPNPASFNGLVADAYCDAVRACGHEAIVRDLYALGFDPLLREHERPGTEGFRLSPDVDAELDILRGSDVFILVYPIWFGMPPAMMKGYVDRVLGAGVTSAQVQHRTAETVLRGKRLVGITSSGASKAWLNEQDQMDSLRQLFGRYLLHAFGMKAYEDLHFGETIEGLDQDYVDANLAQVGDRARAICAAIASDRAQGQAVPPAA